jgi:hypothetical protein
MVERGYSNYLSKYQVVSDVSLVGAAKLKDSRTCTRSEDDSAATEEATPC